MASTSLIQGSFGATLILFAVSCGRLQAIAPEHQVSMSDQLSDNGPIVSPDLHTRIPLRDDIPKVDAKKPDKQRPGDSLAILDVVLQDCNVRGYNGRGLRVVLDKHGWEDYRPSGERTVVGDATLVLREADAQRKDPSWLAESDNSLLNAFQKLFPRFDYIAYAYPVDFHRADRATIEIRFIPTPHGAFHGTYFLRKRNQKWQITSRRFLWPF